MTTYYTSTSDSIETLSWINYYVKHSKVTKYSSVLNRCALSSYTFVGHKTAMEHLQVFPVAFQSAHNNSAELSGAQQDISPEILALMWSGISEVGQLCIWWGKEWLVNWPTGDNRCMMGWPHGPTLSNLTRAQFKLSKLTFTAHLN